MGRDSGIRSISDLSNSQSLLCSNTNTDKYDYATNKRKHEHTIEQFSHTEFP